MYITISVSITKKIRFSKQIRNSKAEEYKTRLDALTARHFTTENIKEYKYLKGKIFKMGLEDYKHAQSQKVTDMLWHFWQTKDILIDFDNKERVLPEIILDLELKNLVSKQYFSNFLLMMMIVSDLF